MRDIDALSWRQVARVMRAGVGTVRRAYSGAAGQPIPFDCTRACLRQEIEDIEYPVGELKAYFAGAAGSALSERSSYIFTFFIKQKFEELKKTAQDFDEDYASEVHE